MKIRSILLSAVMAVMACGVSSAKGLKVFTTTQGEPVSFLFAHDPKVSFLAGKLQVSTSINSEPVKFEIGDVDRIEFFDASGIEEIKDREGVVMTTDALGFNFLNVDPSATAQVFDVAGNLIKQLPVSGDSVKVERAQLGSGIYIVKINKFVTKIAF